MHARAAMFLSCDVTSGHISNVFCQKILSELLSLAELKGEFEKTQLTSKHYFTQPYLEVQLPILHRQGVNYQLFQLTIHLLIFNRLITTSSIKR